MRHKIRHARFRVPVRVRAAHVRPALELKPIERVSGAAVLRIADQSRHKSLDVLRGYVRRVDIFKDQAGAAFL